jgi:hypothetical protein
MRSASTAPARTGASAGPREPPTRKGAGVAPVMTTPRAIEADSGLADLPAVSVAWASLVRVRRSVAAGSSDATIGQQGRVDSGRGGAGSAREARARAAPV